MLKTILFISLTYSTGLSASNLPPFLSKDSVKLSVKEKHATRLAGEWINKRQLPYLAQNGKIIYVYGVSMPSLVCSPLKLCDVELEPGEKVRHLHIGDSARWKANPGLSGPKDDTATTHIILSPLDVGITTSMLVTTDRRTYHIKLVSKKNEFMPRIGFFYPENEKKKWDVYFSKQAKIDEFNTIDKTQEDITKLDFEYSLKGDDPSWKPLRVYNNGVKTIIQMPDAMKQTEAPVLVVIGSDDSEQLVNYRLLNDRFVVDQVFSKAHLVSGVGRAKKIVKITKKGGS